MTYIAILIPLIFIIAGLVFIYKKEKTIFNKKYKYNSSFSDEYDKTGLPIIYCSFCDRNSKVLLDTGATVNCVSKALFESLKLEHIDKESYKKELLFGVNSDEYRESYELSFIMNDELYTERFFIQDLPIDGIDILLGSPFFWKYRWTIDFDKLVIRM